VAETLEKLVRPKNGVGQVDFGLSSVIELARLGIGVSGAKLATRLTTGVG
jgi:hypothetical protein